MTASAGGRVYLIGTVWFALASAACGLAVDRRLPDFGRVLAGFEVEDADLVTFRTFLDELGYPFTPENDNPAYRFFLG